MPIEAKLAFDRTGKGPMEPEGGAATVAGIHVEGADGPPPFEPAFATLPLADDAIGAAGCDDVGVDGSVRSSWSATCATGAVTAVAAGPPTTLFAIRPTPASGGDDVAPARVDVVEETIPATGPPSAARVTPAAVVATSTPVTVLAVVAAAPTVPVAFDVTAPTVPVGFDVTPETTFFAVPVTPPTVCVTVPVGAVRVAAAGAEATFEAAFVTGAGAATVGVLAAGVDTFGAAGVATFGADGAAGVDVLGAAGVEALGAAGVDALGAAGAETFGAEGAACVGAGAAVFGAAGAAGAAGLAGAAGAAADAALVTGAVVCETVFDAAEVVEPTLGAATGRPLSARASPTARKPAVSTARTIVRRAASCNSPSFWGDKP